MSQQIDLEQFTKALESHWDKMTSYTSVILSLGYAALITIWTQADAVLSHWWWVAAGLLAIGSIVIFVTFEVCKVFLVSEEIVRTADTNVHALDGPALERILKVSRLQMKLWRLCFIPIVLTAYGAAAILIAGFAISIL